MKIIAGSALVLCAVVCVSASAAAQTPVGALAIDERQGDQYGWAVDYETPSAAGTRALSECGSGCSVVLTFERCAAYAADQEEGSMVYGWAESYDSSAGARQRALAECGTRGSGCTVRVWGCNGPVVEEGLGLDRAARRQVQGILQAAGFDPGGADGMFGPRTRAAIRSWQTSRGARATGYLDGASVAALRPSVAGQPTFRERSSEGAVATPAAPAAVSAARQQSSATSSEMEVVFWQSIANSTNPAEFEAYLSQFPNGVFRTLAEVRLAALRAGSSAAPAAAGVGGTPATGSRVSGTPAAGVDTRPSAGTVFRPDQTCVGQAVGASCWMEIAGQLGCYVWNPNLQVGETVTWTGECSGGLAQGTGSLTWVWDENESASTGRLQNGEKTGHWVHRAADGGVSEGPYVDGARTGRWVIRYADGGVSEGPYVGGEWTGHWVHRSADGVVQEGPYVDGERTGHWVIRAADGGVSEGPIFGDERTGHWVIRAANGHVYEGSYANNERTGHWVHRGADGGVEEGSYVDGYRDDDWVTISYPHQETAFWEWIKNGTNPADFEAYLGQFANGTFARLARTRLDALEYYHLGDIALATGNNVLARDEFEKAAAADPSWLVPVFHLGLVEMNAGNLEIAKSHFARVVELDPNSSEGAQAQAIVSALQRSGR